GEGRLDALSLRTDKPPERAAILDLARRIRSVAALVFEALDQQPVTAPVGQPSGQQETGRTAVGLGQGVLYLAGQHREEPFVAVDQIGFAGSPSRRGGP